jgi:putative SOS response-associated peptidase YedK
VLVSASGFFEWQKIDAKTKKPYSIGLADDRQLAFAVITDSWKHSGTGEWIETYSIVTTEPNGLTAAVHNRMPVILSPADYQRWLDCTGPERPPVDLLRPFPAEQMTMWPVSSDVDNVGNNRADLLDKAENVPQ